MGSNPLPLTAYLLMPISVIQKIPLLGIFIPDSLGLIILSLSLCIFITKIFSKKMSLKSEIPDFLTLAVVLAVKRFEIQSSVTSLLILMIIKNINNPPLLSIFNSLLLITDMSSIPVMIISFISLMMITTQRLVSPKIRVVDSTFYFLKSLILMFIVPLFFFIYFIGIDILIRNKHSLNALKYSIEFQASLKNFDIQQGFSQAHSSSEPSETDLYVMDRSIISLVNFKHHTFFTLDGNIQSSPDSEIFCEIHKVHAKEFKDEEPRFIKNGDVVKFKDLNESKFLGWDITDSKSKFRNIYLDESKNKEDFWVVEMDDDYLKARTSKVKFRSVKSSDYLCARKIKKNGSLAVSYTADPLSKIFFITENTNHMHYKVTFEDQRPKMKVSNFIHLPFHKKIAEYILSIDPKYSSINEKSEIFKILEKCLISMIIGSILVHLVLYILAVKYNKNLEFSSEAKLCLIGMTVIGILFPFIGFKLTAFEILGSLFTKNIFIDTFRRCKGYFRKVKKTGKRKFL